MRIEFVIGAVFLAVSVQAAEFTVDSTVDAVDALPGDGICADVTGACTLRAAIQETNALVGGDEIELPAGNYVLSIPGTDEDAGATGDLDVLDGLSLVGAASETTIIDAAQIDRVLDAREALTLSGVTIQRGNAGAGGGIICAGSCSVEDSTIGNNTAAGAGGGIIGFSGLHLKRVLVQGNTAGNGGGGIVAFQDLVVENSIVENNTSGWGGGGIYVLGHEIPGGPAPTLIGSTILNNEAFAGGGIFNEGGGARLTNSTVSGNSATVGGGLCGSCVCTGGPTGGCGPCLGGNFIVTNSTLTRNHGGGIADCFNGPSVGYALSNTIVANPLSGADCGDDNVQSNGHNLDSDGTCNLTDPTDLPNADPLLGPLQDNGGPTLTHALLLGSLAIDAIPPVDCTYDDDGDPGTPEVPLTEDQRGVVRPLTGDGAPPTGCDIGAYEVAQCADGLHNDGDGRIDFDGGVTAGLPPEEVTEPDLQCAGPHDTREKSRCGLGFELALLLPLVGARGRLRRLA